MNGNIEAAFTGRLITEPESKTSAAGNPWLRFTVAIGEGETAQYVQVAAFAETATKLAGHIAKGSKVYAEGKLKLDRWEKDGRERSCLSLAAWRVDLIAQIGKQKAKKGAITAYPQGPKNIAARQLAESHFKPEPYRRDRPAVQGLDDFRDTLPW